MLLVYQYSNSFYFRFHISCESWNKNHVHQLNTFFKIIFELWRSIAQAVYETFFCHSMTELRATYFMKFGLRKLSQLTFTYFLRSVPDITNTSIYCPWKLPTHKHNDTIEICSSFVCQFEKFNHFRLKL